MFSGLNQAVTYGSVLTQCYKKSLKLTYNVSGVLCRTQTTTADNYQSVSDFYAGKSVFITGATGFLGKAYVEKLLRGCEDIDKIYLLIRQKRGEPVEARIHQMLKNPIFGIIRKTRPQVFNKIVPIVGDICEPKLGIKQKDEETLKNEVSVVIHSAATVRFNDPLHMAMNANFEGTRRVLDLCKGMKNLDNFVYVSTTYSQNMHKVLHEKIYPAPKTVEEIYGFLKKYTNHSEETAKFIGPQPNTYAFTKSLSENYVGTNPKVPTTIVRPSAVNATYKEPVKGWLDNWYSGTGVCFDSARGLNHYIIGKESNITDAIPVDYVANMTIIAGAKHNSENGSVPVYNSASSGSNPLTLNRLHQGFIKENLKYGFYEKQPHLSFYDSEFMVNLLTLLRMKIPAHAADIMLQLQGKEPRHVKVLQRVLMTRRAMEFLQKRSWMFKNDCARKLFASLSAADKAKFPCDPNDIDWDEYLKIYFNGITEYLLPSLLANEKSRFVPDGKGLA